MSEIQRARRALRRARTQLARLTVPEHCRPWYSAGSWAWARRALERRKTWLLGHPDVVGCGLGFRIRGSAQTDEPCITVYVKRKRPESRLGAARRLPRYVRVGKRRLGLDVVTGGRYEAQALVGDELGTLTAFATLGAFALDVATGRDVALTAMHVAGVNSISGGAPVVTLFAPSRALRPGAPLLGTILEGTKSRVDAAKVELAAGQTAVSFVPDFGPVRGWRPLVWPADRNLPVWLYGAVSKRQSGHVNNPHDFFVDDTLDEVITAQIESQLGDSGAALFDNDGFVLGFLAGRRRESELRVFCPAQAVLERLGCDIPTP